MGLHYEELLSVPEASKRLRVGRTVLYELIRDNKLDALKIGAKRLILASSIAELVADSVTHGRTKSKGAES